MTPEINLDAIQTIESGGNAKAFNFRTKATGLFQITPICLDDWNAEHPALQYKLGDLWDPQINRKIATWYIDERIPQMLRHFKLPVSDKAITFCYNWGIGNYRNWVNLGSDERALPQETRNYYEKYKRLCDLQERV